MLKTATAVRIPTARRAPASTAPQSAGTFRRDVEGLRGVAVAAVVLFHAGVPGLSGGYVGVDVFFVISGFLITSLMLREVAETGRLSLVAFYCRRARRILPAASLVLVAVILAGYHWLGFLRGDTVATDATWAALFASNVRFAAQGVDYLASQGAPSPLQHFWSLAVEEQFYLVWPVALAVLVRFGRRFDPGRTLPYWLGTAVGASLAWSVLHTDTWSYFSPLTRAWELGAGALLALAAGRLHRIPYGLAAALGWLGVTVIVCAVLVFDDTTPFPGYAAAVPVLGALLVLAGRGDALLGRGPLPWLGRLSYSLYLWHWPVLVIAQEAYGDALPAYTRALLVLLSLALAATTYAVVENPIRRHPRLRRPALALALAAALIAAPVAVARWTTSTSPAGAGDGAEYQPRLGAPIAHVEH